MKVKFKASCKLPIALAVGDEVGTVVSGNVDSYTVTFEVYGATFGTGAENFEIVEE